MGLLSRTSYVPHPQGAFMATLVDIVWESEGQYGPQIRFKFDSEELMPEPDENGQDRCYRMSYWATPKLNERANLYGLIQTLGGDPTDEMWDAPEDPAALIDLLWSQFEGKKVQLFIIHAKKTDGSLRDKVDKVLPIPPPSRRLSATREPVGAGARGAAEDPKWKDGD